VLPFPHTVTAKGDPLMKHTHTDLSAHRLTTPRLAGTSWFLIRPQLLTLV
jgi:hypothetical protein